MDAIQEIEQLYENRGSITGLPTGFVELDRMTSGLHPAEMIVIAARPNMGKTAFARTSDTIPTCCGGRQSGRLAGWPADSA
jgi:replicative DNA helicase